MDRRHFVKDSLVVVCSSEQVPPTQWENCSPFSESSPVLLRPSWELKARIYKRCHDLTQRKFNLLSSQAGLDLSPYRFHPGPVLFIWQMENLARTEPN